MLLISGQGEFETGLFCHVFNSLQPHTCSREIACIIKCGGVWKSQLTEPFIYYLHISLANKSVCNILLFKILNRTHACTDCFYQVIETKVEVWENENCCGNKQQASVFK